MKYGFYITDKTNKGSVNMAYTEYEISLYDGRRKHTCYSLRTPENLMKEWSNHNKLMERHETLDRKVIMVAKGSVDYIRLI